MAELFGSAGMSGFAELALLDSNQDGVINASDAAFANLRVWKDIDGDGKTDAGELQTLTQAGIASIGLTATPSGAGNALNVVARTGTFTRTDATTGTVGDVEFQIDNFNTVYLGDNSVDPAIAASMPNLKGHGTLTDLHVALTLQGPGGALAAAINEDVTAILPPATARRRPRCLRLASPRPRATNRATSNKATPRVPVLRVDRPVRACNFR